METVEVLETDVRFEDAFHFYKKEEDENYEKREVEDQAGMTRWYYQRVNFTDNLLAGKLTKFVGVK